MTAPRRDPSNREELEISHAVRAVETGSVLLFFSLELWLAFRLHDDMDLTVWGWLAVVIGAFLLADLISGLFHWAADTWASTNTPVIGGLFVRPFREHHVDQLAITRHDFFEVSGANCAIALPWLAVHFFDLEASNDLAIGAGFLGLFLFFIFLTSLSHRWAHADRVPRIARLLQKSGVLLSPDHHRRHHKAPHTSHYCITSGLWNPILDHTRFFRFAEWVVHHVTGLIPREDDAQVTGLPAAEPPGADGEIAPLAEGKSPASS